MEAVAFHHHNLLRFSMCFSFSKLCYLGKSSISMKEVAVQPSIFVFPKVVTPFTNSSIRSDGDKGGQTRRRNENKRPQSFDGKKSKSSEQEEIIALFRRIQSSISKGDSQDTNSKRSSNADKDKHSTESILDILGEPKKQLKAGKIPNKAKEKELTNRRVVSRKEQGVEEHAHVSDKLTRPPSNLVKKSPIPSLPSPGGKVIELNNEALPAIMGNKQEQSEGLEELKLAELKEVAKSRGVKGYSKLKKGELLKILRS